MKSTTLYVCSQCAYQSSKWEGRCPSCEKWNTFEQESVRAPTARSKKIMAHSRDVREYAELLKRDSLTTPRLSFGIKELDRVLGGGLVPGSMLLLTGEPGIGKSTLTLQMAERLSLLGKKVLYISAEESEEQVALRGKRLGLTLKNLSLLSESSLETIIATAETTKCDFLIIDSIQVIRSDGIPAGAGSVSQVRLCAETLLNYAKPKNLPVLMIGHVTKDGTLAGPRVLEHLVDTVLYIEGDRTHDVRVLRAVKNRFGAVSEIGLFEMEEIGLVEITNPAAYFIEKREKMPIGCARVVTLEGTRPIVLEVQALTNTTTFGYPRRTASGFDANRLQVLIAVLQKHLNVDLSNQDVFVNVVSGYKLSDPGCDLGVCLALISSYYKKTIPATVLGVGEIGLAGEVRIPKHITKKEKEITKLGFTFEKGKKRLAEFVEVYR